MSAGIDYGLGKTNIDLETGIRYGVISQNSIVQAWADNSEGQYGSPSCPKCNREAKEYDPDAVKETTEHGGGCTDYFCADCDYSFDSSDAFPDEPHGYVCTDPEYVAETCLDNDVMVLKSPFYTLARFCSPCVPGAGDLNTPDALYGVKTYCFSHDWFDDGIAPYPVFLVADDSNVHPDQGAA